MSNISIVVLSCAKFSDMWINNLSLFESNWPCHPKIILTTDFDDPTVSLKNQLVKNNLLIINKDMSGRLIEGISLLNTKYVFLTLDDYYLSKKASSKSIDAIVQIMDSHNLSYCRLFKEKKVNSPFNKEKDIKFKYLPLNDVYEVNFYPSIWKVSSLIKVLKNGEDIWKTETRLTRRFKENHFSGIAIYDKTIFPFVDVVRKGKYLPKAFRFIKRNKLVYSNRPVLPLKERIVLTIKTFISDSPFISKTCKERIKKRYREKGGILYSDYANTDD